MSKHPLSALPAALAMALGVASCGPREDAKGRELDPRVIQARGTLAESEQATIAIFQSAAPSVVLVISGAGRGGLTGDLVSAGTGFVWDEAGHIVTNNHVVQGGDITVRFAGGEDVPAQIIGQRAAI